MPQTSFEESVLVDTLTPRQNLLCEQSSDGSLVAVSSSGGVINVYKKDKQELLVRLRVLREVTQLRFIDLDDGTPALAASGWDGTLRLWALRQLDFQNLEVDNESDQLEHGEWLESDGQRWMLSLTGPERYALPIEY